MIRAGAKNHSYVSVVTDPADYHAVALALEADGTVDAETRQRLAQKAFQQTAAYDQMIADWLTQQTQKTKPEQAEYRLNLSAQKTLDLRYGENPHQTAGLYASQAREPSVVHARQIQGKALSYNNINDTDAPFGWSANSQSRYCHYQACQPLRCGSYRYIDSSMGTRTGC
ncbi:MAG: hypothetical protein CM15mP119_3830 [Alphaproteobacteria bacterium]|nr:MAG: hypothetical protein CM15mP119_3830 [Alphaproteobacteria bacterium]